MTRNVIGVIVAVAVLYALWLVQTNRVGYYQVTSGSMEPTLKVGSRYVMSRPDSYRVGDIIVFKEPGQQARSGLFTKRIVAIGPANVELKSGQLYVDGKRNDPPQGPAAPVKIPNKSWKLAAGQYFICGDNRVQSYDSRDYGPIERSQIKGRIHPEAL